MYVRIPQFPIYDGEPESRVHRGVRIFFARLHNLLNWRVPKWFGRDRCEECGEQPCGTRVGSSWRCSLHSCFVAE